MGTFQLLYKRLRNSVVFFATRTPAHFFFLQVDELFITALLNAKGSFLLLNQGCIKTNLKSLDWLPVGALVALRFEWLNFKTFQMSDIMHNRRCANWNKYNKGCIGFFASQEILEPVFLFR